MPIPPSPPCESNVIFGGEAQEGEGVGSKHLNCAALFAGGVVRMQFLPVDVDKMEAPELGIPNGTLPQDALAVEGERDVCRGS
jgi:hypothetical protein